MCANAGVLNGIELFKWDGMMEIAVYDLCWFIVSTCGAYCANILARNVLSIERTIFQVVSLKFDVTMSIQAVVFWVVAVYIIVNEYRPFGDTLRSFSGSTSGLDATCFFETSVSTTTARCHTLKHQNLIERHYFSLNVNLEWMQFMERMTERKRLEDIGVDGKIILKWILKE